MKDFTVPPAYRVIANSELKEIGLTGTVLEHERSGARVICLPSSFNMNMKTCTIFA